MNQGGRRPWWETPHYALALVLLMAVPLLWPDIPPLVDLPGHMGRYKVQLDLDSSAALRSYYDFQWQLIGNLGIDLLIVPMSKIFGLELGLKLIVIAIPVLTAAGFLAIAHEVHGKLPPTAALALPLAYGFPFHFGFINFALSAALAMLAFALWLRLAHQKRFVRRAILFVPLSSLIWVTHAFGWGILGLLAFSSELIRHRDEGLSWVNAAWKAALDCIPLMLPFCLMIAWRSGEVGGNTGDWFNMRVKAKYAVMALRDRWIALDLASIMVLIFFIYSAVRAKTVGLSRMLSVTACFLLLTYLLLPRVLLGSAYADMRLFPFILAIAVLAIRYKEGWSAKRLAAIAILSLGFFLVRIASTTTSFWMYDRQHDRILAAVEHIPQGARLVSFVGSRCAIPWEMTRNEHISALALVRREAFSNDQWVMPGAQLLTVKYRAGKRFENDPSQIVTLKQCRGELWMPIGKALKDLPRNAFDYVWLINPPAYDRALLSDYTQIWRDGPSILYRRTDLNKVAHIDKDRL